MMLWKPKERKEDINRKSNSAEGQGGEGGQFSGLDNRAEVTSNFNKI